MSSDNPTTKQCPTCGLPHTSSNSTVLTCPDSFHGLATPASDYEMVTTPGDDRPHKRKLPADPQPVEQQLYTDSNGVTETADSDMPEPILAENPKTSRLMQQYFRWDGEERWQENYVKMERAIKALIAAQRRSAIEDTQNKVEQMLTHSLQLGDIEMKAMSIDEFMAALKEQTK